MRPVLVGWRFLLSASRLQTVHTPTSKDKTFISDTPCRGGINMMKAKYHFPFLFLFFFIKKVDASHEMLQRHYKPYV